MLKKTDKIVLEFSNNKIDVFLRRSGQHYSAGWKSKGSDNINWCLGFYCISYPINYPWQRKKSWTGFRKAMKEFHLLVNTSTHPNIQFITRKKNENCR
jgi:hypothetical protein